ncbi:HAMP domain-containing protein [Paenibacillus sp. sptzw28]|uniref:sensor histidine kinase n=1 Tax=Paenibacillus sp. sptzw28 TaxID=715179 RepID=UPI001C6E4FAB|nr:HAMP domain-containing sensor histidine kinase [Paenibacillus sp. sptzw28]QYR22990.1 HAMP domain-containing protein [Paenibacillus sp. sptzw28]
MRIGTKLQLGNLALIITVLAITALSFHVLSGQYMLKEARSQMKIDAEAFARSLKGLKSDSDLSAARRIINRHQLRILGHAIDSKVIVFDNENRILYTNVGADEVQSIQKLDQQGNADYLIERRLIRSEEGATIGRILLAVQIKDVNDLNRLLRRAQLVSGIIGGTIALGMGALLGRSIARPIQSLAGGMRRFSPRKELPEIAVHSGDEIGELAESFIVMADKLRANDKMQTDFLQNASHELKTPLMAIQGNAEAIKDGIVREREAEESLDVIIAQCQRLKTVVDELIYLTRVDHQPDALRLEPAAIGEIIGEAAAGVRGLADQQGIAIMVTGDLNSAGAFDREKLKRALINIIGNGIRYAKTKVVVQAIARAGQLEIVCEDDGKGLSPGEEERIFDRFYKGEYGGTGIGLAITKAIVEAHGGSIAADSANPGVGAVIRIVLPAAQEVRK